jgi:hypothetical protein
MLATESDSGIGTDEVVDEKQKVVTDEVATPSDCQLEAKMILVQNDKLNQNSGELANIKPTTVGTNKSENVKTENELRPKSGAKGMVRSTKQETGSGSAMDKRVKSAKLNRAASGLATGNGKK